MFIQLFKVILVLLETFKVNMLGYKSELEQRREMLVNETDLVDWQKVPGQTINPFFEKLTYRKAFVNAAFCYISGISPYLMLTDLTKFYTLSYVTAKIH